MPSIMIVSAVLAILTAVVVSGAITRLMRSIVPLPIVQIAMGLLLGMATDLRLRIDPQTFLLLFLPPLLFLDAWRISNDALRRDASIIVELALGLVIATVIGLGFFLHWLLPSLPMPLCFAIGAVLSPTDAVAVGAMTQRKPIPARLSHILGGEALLNDGSALVCLRFAVTALIAGRFSFLSAVPTFIWVVVAGLAAGAVLAWVVGTVGTRLAARFGEDPGAHVLVTILLPFGAYLLGEAVGASGILSAVAAGLCMSRMDWFTPRPAATRIRRQATWDMIGVALNGSVFVLLGEQLSIIVHLGRRSIVESGAQTLSALSLDILFITLFLFAVRAIWVWSSLRFNMHRRTMDDSLLQPSWALVAATTAAGVRGTVTLVAVLTIPRSLPDGTSIPAVAVAVTLATGVILTSLVLASVGLPLSLRRLAPDDEPESADSIRSAVANRALEAVEKLCADRPGRHGESLHQEYRVRAGLTTQRLPSHAEEHDLRIAALEAERSAVIALHVERRIADDTADTLLAELDAAELFHTSRLSSLNP